MTRTRAFISKLTGILGLVSEQEDVPDRDFREDAPDHEGLSNRDVRESDTPLQNPSVTAYRVGEDAVLHDAEREQVFAVTGLTWRMWDRCDGNTPLSEIGHKISEETGAPLPKVMGALPQVASRLRDQELLSLHGGHRDDAEDLSNTQTLSIGFESHQVLVQTDAPKFARGARRAFHGMLGGASGKDPNLKTVGVLNATSSEGRYHVRDAGGSRGRTSTLEDVIHTLEGVIRKVKHKVLRRFMEARPDLIWLHAGAATRDGTSVLVTGPWGSGKSTVIAGLCRSGWKYLSDDMAPYDPSSGEILPYPTTIAYREPEERALSREELTGLPKKRVSLKPEHIQKTPVRPEAIFFPKYDPDHPAKTAPRAAAEAAVSLVESCQNAGRHHGEAVARLCQLAGQTPAFQLRYNDQSNTSSLLSSVTEQSNV